MPIDDELARIKKKKLEELMKRQLAMEMHGIKIVECSICGSDIS